MQAAARAVRTDIRTRTGEGIILGHALYSVDVATCFMGTPSIPASKQQEWNPMGNPSGYVSQGSCTSFHRGVHDSRTD